MIDHSFEQDFEKSIELLNKKKDHIQTEAQNLADKMYEQTAVIYTAHGFEGVGVRFRQQINENSKCFVGIMLFLK